MPFLPILMTRLSSARSIFIALFLILSISACSSEGPASAADSGDNSNVASTPQTSPSPTSAPGPVAVAMYSYNADLTGAKPLENAVLEQTRVYLFFNKSSAYSSMNFYCCKGISGASAGEAHKTAVSDSSAPFVYSIDTSQFSTTGNRELYVDAARSDGSGYNSLTANFSINITKLPPPPVTSDISLSWVAPSEREDNSALSLSDIAGYKIYYGTTKGKYDNSVTINDSSAQGHTIKDLPAGTHYFVITTRDVDGRESQFSSEVIITI